MYVSILFSLGYDQRFSFDPRYGHSRLAEFDTVRGQITDIKKDRVIVCSNHTLKTKVYRVEYTNDGHLIIVLCTCKSIDMFRCQMLNVDKLVSLFVFH
jgi:hypothetical protein